MKSLFKCPEKANTRALKLHHEIRKTAADGYDDKLKMKLDFYIFCRKIGACRCTLLN